MAVSALGDALGISEPTQAKIEQAFKTSQLSGDQLVAVKLAEQNLALKLEELGVKREELAVENVKDARNMQIQTRSWFPAALSFMVVAGYFGILTGLLVGTLTLSDNQSLLILIGALSTAFGGVLNFWLGSSHGSQSKDQLVFNSSPVK
jgi:hypothetical protein